MGVAKWLLVWVWLHLQADKVRQLKASGASKETIDAEVKILKELKAKLGVGVAEPPKEQKAGSKGKKKAAA